MENSVTMMKLNAFLVGLSLSVSSLSLVPLSYASEFGRLARTSDSLGRFYCGTFKESPAILSAHPARGNAALLKLSGSYFNASKWTPEKRCVAIARKFQMNKEARTLKFLVPGLHKGQSVVCASVKEVSNQPNCSAFNVLFTFNPEYGGNVKAIVRDLVAVSGDANARVPLQASNGLYGSEEEGYYLDVEKFFLTTAEYEDEIL